MLESITETQWAAAYAVVSLIIWLGYEMSGMATEAPKDPIDRHVCIPMLIPLWLPILGFVVCALSLILLVTSTGKLLDMARGVSIGRKVPLKTEEFPDNLDPLNRARYEAGENYEFRGK